jgi:hypothetical protein
MKDANLIKVFRSGEMTIVVAHDPEGSFARKVAHRSNYNEHLERAKATLRNNPLPDYILQAVKEHDTRDQQNIAD